MQKLLKFSGFPLFSCTLCLLFPSPKLHHVPIGSIVAIVNPNLYFICIAFQWIATAEISIQIFSFFLGLDFYCTRPVHSCGLFPILDNAFGLSHETQKELVASYGDQPWEVCQEKVEDMIRERKARMESCRVSMSF